MSDVRVEELVVEYVGPEGAVRPLDGFSLTVRSGSLILVMGPSGSGKTTLLSCLAGILTPTAGRVLVGGTDVARLSGPALLSHRRHRVGIVFQAFNLVPSLTAAENVMIPLMASGETRAVARRRALALLDQLDLGSRAARRPGQLSGGQQQRVAIARALGLDPPLLLADEPTAHLDREQVGNVLDILRRLVTGGRTAVVATHDERLRAIADDVVDVTGSPAFAGSESADRC